MLTANNSKIKASKRRLLFYWTIARVNHKNACNTYTVAGIFVSRGIKE